MRTVRSYRFTRVWSTADFVRDSKISYRHAPSQYDNWNVSLGTMSFVICEIYPQRSTMGLDARHKTEIRIWCSRFIRINEPAEPWLWQQDPFVRQQRTSYRPERRTDLPSTRPTDHEAASTEGVRMFCASCSRLALSDQPDPYGL